MLTKLELEDKTVFLLGTAHVSKLSEKEVEDAISEIKPEIIAVELDEQRFHQLKHEAQWNEQAITNVIKEGKIYLFLFNLILASMQRKIGRQLHVKPGLEMVQAINVAEKNSIPIAFVDRDVKVTLKRALQKMPLKEKLKIFLSLVFGLLESDSTIKLTSEQIEKMKDKDVLTELMEELSREAPTIKEVLVDERDEFIAGKLREINAKKVLAVIGAGHVSGIEKILKENRKIELKRLSEIKEKKSNLRHLKWLIPLLLVAFLAFALLTGGVEKTLSVLAYWILIVGGASAIGAIIARAHPLSILVSFALAPFTTVHPLLAVGWFSGYVEMKFRAPKVKDFNELNKLGKISDFFRNQVTRILLVIALSNVGATIGVIIAVPFIASLLA